MKILIVQLARLGDIYLTWPMAHALKRKYPNAELHFMTRKKFSGALEGLQAIDKSWTFDSAEYINEYSTAEECKKMTSFLGEVKNEEYDQIINLSFSPLSSYITNFITSKKTLVKGYTRNTDGTLSIPDDASAFFYAQVGVGRSNRLHLTKIFSAICEVDIVDEDWSIDSHLIDKSRAYAEGLKLKKFCVLHIAGSTADKSLPVAVIRQIISETLLFWDGEIVLVGGEADLEKSQNITNGIEQDRLINLVGKTSLRELIQLVEQSKLVIGADSCPMHIASLLNASCLLLTNESANFWETGPLGKESQVYAVQDWNNLNIEKINEYISAFLTGQDSSLGFIELTAGLRDELESYNYLTDETSSFGWGLVKAIYFGENFPVLSDLSIFRSLQDLRELSVLVCEQIETLVDPEKVDIAIKLIDSADELIDKIKSIHPSIRPLIEWFQTEKIRIQPGEISDLRQQTEKCYMGLNSVLDIYLGPDPRLDTQEQI